MEKQEKVEKQASVPEVDKESDLWGLMCCRLCHSDEGQPHLARDTFGCN